MWDDIEKIERQGKIFIQIIRKKTRWIKIRKKPKYFKVSYLWETVDKSFLGRIDWFYKILLIIVTKIWENLILKLLKW